MGVRGIFSLLRKNLTSFSTRREYHADTVEEGGSPSKRDLIVVDGNAFVYWFVSFVLGREASCQTDYALLSQRLDEWLRQCYRLQMAFIFIFDGPTQPSKWPTKIKRMRNQSRDIYHSQMHKLHGGKKGEAPSVASVPPVLAMQTVLQVLLQHQSTLEEGMLQVCHAEGEADEEIARVAVEQVAIAILSNDSDMLFFHTKQAISPDEPNSAQPARVMPVSVPLLPFASFHISEKGQRLVMEALIQRDCLAKSLGVRSEHLWLVAALLGHDSSDPDILLEIHRCLRDGITSSLSSRSYSSFSDSQNERSLVDPEDDWLDTDNSTSNPKQKKKKNPKVSKSKKSPSKRTTMSSTASLDTPSSNSEVSSPSDGSSHCGMNRDNGSCSGNSVVPTKVVLLRSACSAPADGDEFLLSSQDTIKAASKLFKCVYTSVEASIDFFRGNEFASFGYSMQSPSDVYNNEDAMCICVVSVLLSVPAIGVLQAVFQRNKKSSLEGNIISSSSGSKSSMPWCVRTSKTAVACCRLFDCLKAAHETYTIQVFVREENDHRPLFSCSHDLDSELKRLESTSMYRVPWDMQMVVRHQLFLPRVSYEYSGMRQPSVVPKMLGEIDFTELYVDKAYRGMFQKTLCDANAYEHLRGVRTLIYQVLHHRSDSQSNDQIVEILRRGNSLEVASFHVRDTSDPILDCDDNTCRFFDLVLHKPLTTLLLQAWSNFDTIQMPGCAECKRIFNMRCLQLKILVMLMGVTFTTGSTEENTPDYNIYTFQLSIVLLVARYLCHELIDMSCNCFKTCNFLAEGSSDLFRRMAVADASQVLTDFQFTNLWSAVEVSVLHCDYLMFCIWKNSSSLSDYSHLFPEEGQGVADKYSESTKEMQLPYACLSPGLFAAVHRAVVLGGKSRDISSFIASCFKGCCDGLMEAKAKKVFHLFVEVAMSPMASSPEISLSHCNK